MPLIRSSSRPARAWNYLIERAAGKPKRQARAIAHNVSRKSPGRKCGCKHGRQ